MKEGEAGQAATCHHTIGFIVPPPDVRIGYLGYTGCRKDWDL